MGVIALFPVKSYVIFLEIVDAHIQVIGVPDLTKFVFFYFNADLLEIRLLAFPKLFNMLR